MIDWNLIAGCVSVALFTGAVAGYIIREIEGFDPKPDVHSGPDDVESRARRVQ